ncbi:phage holin family protein [Lactococcus lactis]|uniref:phage holin family protein n=1 Tax=Lactococcus lactis TaxID=1358 RepID=UPI00325CA215
MRDFLEIYHDFYALDFVHHWTFALLVFIVIVDIVLGLLKGWATNTFKSSIARKGIVSHGTLIFIVVAVYPWISELGFSLLADAVMLFFIVSYIASVIGNLETLGVPIPTYIKNKLAEEIKSKDDTITEIFEQKKKEKENDF